MLFRFRKKLILYTLFCLVFFATVLGLHRSEFLRWVDINFCNECLRDTYGRTFFDEDWLIREDFSAKLDYKWLEIADKPILIAHALGAAGLSDSNTLTQMASSFAKGFIFFELDVTLDREGILRCAHNPKNMLKYKNGDCTFQKVINYVKHNKLFLIIDIKSDFKLTADVIFSKVSKSDASRVIFQLYQPEHVRIFSEFLERKSFAGPIVTLYRSRRSVEHVLSALSDSNIKVVTIPRYRLPALSINKHIFNILTHPVHNCNDLIEVGDIGMAGFYVTNAMLPRRKSLCG